MKKEFKTKIESMIPVLDMFVTVAEAALDAEQERYDNLSERSQESERGEVIQERIDYLQELVDHLTEASECCCNALDE